MDKCTLSSDLVSVQSFWQCMAVHSFIHMSHCLCRIDNQSGGKELILGHFIGVLIPFDEKLVYWFFKQSSQAEPTKTYYYLYIPLCIKHNTNIKTRRSVICIICPADAVVAAAATML